MKYNKAPPNDDSTAHGYMNPPFTAPMVGWYGSIRLSFGYPYSASAAWSEPLMLQQSSQVYQPRRDLDLAPT